MATHEIDADTREMGLAAIGAKREALQAELKANRQKSKELDQRAQQIAMDLRDCDAAERLFGKTSEAPNTPLEFAFPAPATRSGPLPEHRAVRIKVVVLEQLKKAGQDGTKAKFIRNYIERDLQIQIHEKTVGMYLYRLAQEGWARREGIRWFYTEPEVMK